MDENDWVTGHEMYASMELGEPDASGRRRPVEDPKDPSLTIDVDTVIMSLGTSPNPLISSTTMRS